MTDVINMYFWCVGQLWSVIVAHWLLGAFVLVLLLGYVVSLIKDTLARK